MEVLRLAVWVVWTLDLQTGQVIVPSSFSTSQVSRQEQWNWCSQDVMVDVELLSRSWHIGQGLEWSWCSCGRMTGRYCSTVFAITCLLRTGSERAKVCCDKDKVGCSSVCGCWVEERERKEIRLREEVYSTMNLPKVVQLRLLLLWIAVLNRFKRDNSEILFRELLGWERRWWALDTDSRGTSMSLNSHFSYIHWPCVRPFGYRSNCNKWVRNMNLFPKNLPRCLSSLVPFILQWRLSKTC